MGVNIIFELFNSFFYSFNSKGKLIEILEEIKQETLEKTKSTFENVTQKFKGDT